MRLYCHKEEFTVLKAGLKTSFTVLSVLFTFACTPADEKHEHSHHHSNEHSQEHTHKHHEHVATSDVIVETSGIRIGTAAITTRGLKETDCLQVVDWVDRVVSNYESDPIIKETKSQINKFMEAFPLYAEHSLVF